MTPASLDNYTYVGDAAAIAICLVMVILMTTSYISRTRSYRIFMTIIASLVVAASLNIVHHALLPGSDPSYYGLIYGLRVLYQAFLFNVFFLFALYTTQVSGMEHKKARVVAVSATILMLMIVGTEIVRAVGGFGFRTTENGMEIQKTNLFIIGYVLFVIFLAVLLTRAQKLIYKRVMYGFYGTMAVSVAIRFGQMLLNQSSLTTLTFVFPTIAMLYIMHSNPYNVTLGTVDSRAMEDLVRNMYARKEAFIFLSLLLPEFDEEGKELPEAIRASLRKNADIHFRHSVIFQVSHGHMVLLAPQKRNSDYEKRIKNMLDSFAIHYQRFQLPYKIVMGESMEEISRKNEYVSFIRSVQRCIPDNVIHRVTQDDIDRFNKDEYILRELTDIFIKKNVDDPRVLAYCQPVYNLKTGAFDTAEALMRLKLEKTGIVTPDQFIGPAESHGYIHVLTEIILHKTCQAIRRMTDEGFQINRISVNVSVLELKEDEFCADVNKIIGGDSVSGEKIAIELTETRTESDFMIMKKKIEELHRQGIQFYLDDFGTGYSNMERIMELPFDIIKFDRSLVVASGTDERSEKIVENLAHLFEDMDYSVLYEGVENETDEERCREMSASYLQGYKYSRPVPIDQLRRFLPKAG